MTTRAKLAEILREARKRLGTWAAVSDKRYNGEVNPTILSRIASPHDKYWPADKDIAAILIPPKPKAAERCQPVQIFCTDEQKARIQARYTTRERTKKLLEGEK